MTILSLAPPFIAIILAIRTKQVFISLLFGIWLGWIILHGGNLLTGSFATVQALVDVFQDEGNTRTVMFCALVGALIVFIQKSGGVEGFINVVNRWMQKREAMGKGKSRVTVQLLAWLTGLLIFVESSVSVLTVGALYRPIFDKMGIPREKLAYIADSSSAPACILMPFNAWGAFIMGLLLTQGFENPLSMLLQSMVYNFYPILALLFGLGIIFTQKDFGAMEKAETRAREEGKLLADDAVPMMSSDITLLQTKTNVTPKAFNMIIPILTMVVMMPIMLIYTGWEAAIAALPNANGFETALFAIGNGSGSTAVLMAVITSILISMTLYKIQGIFGIREMVDLSLEGIAALLPLALLMVLAFAIGAVCKELQTGLYIATAAKSWLSPALVPAIVFSVSCIIAFSTGTSWGTFAIMIAIAMPMAQTMGVNVHLALAAALGGGIFGDHCSPISDTTILSSMASASDHIDHVKTQMPYALAMGGVSLVLYLILGFIL
ncbi:MAG: Na+/H+ antiporter NhaC family protein [Chitinophagales bacterium]